MTEAGASTTSGSVVVGGVPWAYTEAGSGPLVCFLHGTLSDRRVFSSEVEVLARHYRCVAVDRPGHGGSGFDPSGWTVDQLVAGLPRLVDALGESSAALVGLSQGGAVALRVALAHPETVAALVTIGAGPDGPAPDVVASLEELPIGNFFDPDRLVEARAKGLSKDDIHAGAWSGEYLPEHPPADVLLPEVH